MLPTPAAKLAPGEPLGDNFKKEQPIRELADAASNHGREPGHRRAPLESKASGVEGTHAFSDSAI